MFLNNYAHSRAIYHVDHTIVLVMQCSIPYFIPKSSMRLFVGIPKIKLHIPQATFLSLVRLLVSSPPGDISTPIADDLGRLELGASYRWTQYINF